MKIVRNTTLTNILTGGVILEPGIDYTIPPQEYSQWSANTTAHNLITSGDIVVNNGSQDLSAEVGLVHIQNGVAFKHDDVALLPIVGEDAATLVSICPAAIGYQLDIGDKVYGQTRIDRLVGKAVQFQIHMTIDNSESDKWVQFEISYFTTNGRDDLKQINSIDGTVNTIVKEVPSTPYLVFEAVVDIPTTAFDNDETYLFLGIKRISPVGKTSPTNSPIILRYCKRYFQEFA